MNKKKAIKRCAREKTKQNYFLYNLKIVYEDLGGGNSFQFSTRIGKKAFVNSIQRIKKRVSNLPAHFLVERVKFCLFGYKRRIEGAVGSVYKIGTWRVPKVQLFLAIPGDYFADVFGQIRARENREILILGAIFLQFS
jgi:hypothetical protein